MHVFHLSAQSFLCVDKSDTLEESCLLDLAHCTKALESNSNTLDNTLPALDWLLNRYEASNQSLDI
jgi:hypothetical protein